MFHRKKDYCLMSLKIAVCMHAYTPVSPRLRNPESGHALKAQTKILHGEGCFMFNKIVSTNIFKWPHRQHCIFSFCRILVIFCHRQYPKKGRSLAILHRLSLFPYLRATLYVFCTPCNQGRRCCVYSIQITHIA